jgi:single-stranded-DNA-specific exonuclease
LIASGLSPLLARLLARRGIGTPEQAATFLAPSLEQLADPYLLTGMAEAVERLAAAREGGHRIALVGDYDVDGISSVALLTAVFQAAGLEVEPILPHRMHEGYGFQPLHVERARQGGCRLILTADCGATSNEAVAAACAAGLDVIVTDHHLIDGPGPPGAVMINPKRAGNEYPFDELCAAGLSLQLARAFAARVGLEVPAERLARIACLGTICDLVPLLGENRAIAARGLEALPSTPSPGLQALFEEAGIGRPISASDVGFRVGPRLNAAGRMANPEPALELLLERDPARARLLASRLAELNQQRRTAEEQVVDAARERLAERSPLPGLLVAWDESWHRGVLGIAAGRLAQELHRPVLLLQALGEVATGSGRSISGIHLYETLSPWRNRLERFGGHAQAIGLSVAVEELSALRREWEEAGARFAPELLVPRVRYEEAFAAHEVTRELLDEIERLRPFGVANPRPVLRVGPLRLSAAPRRFGRGHLSAMTAGAEDGARLDVVGWGWGERGLPSEGPFEIVGRLDLDRYLGRPVVRLVDARSLAGHSSGGA